MALDATPFVCEQPETLFAQEDRMQIQTFRIVNGSCVKPAYFFDNFTPRILTFADNMTHLLPMFSDIPCVFFFTAPALPADVLFHISILVHA